MSSMKYRMPLAALTVASLASVVFSQFAGAQALLLDNFVSDSSLDAILWTTKSVALDKLANYYSSSFKLPALSFTQVGMQMAGAAGEYEITGVASVRSFAPPFTLTTTVQGTVANGNPFVVFLMTGDFTNCFMVTGNLNNQNAGYYGIWANYTGNDPGDDQSFIHLGDDIYPRPLLNVPYTLQLSVDSSGSGTVVVAATNGNILALETGLTVGTGPFHVVLAQREGTPNTVGPNVAVWNSINVESGALPPMLTSANQSQLGSNLIIQTSTDMQNWTDLTRTPSSNAPIYLQETGAGPKRYYRAIPRGN
jgi:hypothetical protein